MKKAVLIALLAVTTLSQAFGGTIASYVQGDVLIGFRTTGGSSDLVADLGPIATFTNASPNQRLTFSTVYTTNQLYVIGLNGLDWDAFTWLDNGTTAILFNSQARSQSVNTQAFTPPSSLESLQEITESDMQGVQAGAGNESGYNLVLNTSTAVLEPDNNNSYSIGESYGFAMVGSTSLENFGGDFYNPQQDCEQQTPSNFTTKATVSRADFFWVNPKANNGSPNNVKYLGYFELNTNGVLSYVAYPVSAPTVPVIQSITRSGNVSSISFSTGNSGTYSLRGTNSAGLITARTNWPAITYGLGTGSVLTLKDTNTTSAAFYVITAQ